VSIAFVKKALQKFLSDPTPEVLCIKGKWGVGKTYTWEQALKEAVANKTLPFKQYAYVSLFGIKDSSDILQSIFATSENPYPPADEKGLPDVLGGHKLRELELGKKFKSVLGFAAEHATVPHIAGLGGVARAILSSFVGNTLVCIDDFERKSASVTVNEIMGTIAQLRDARKCKVVLILNEDSLDKAQQEEFQRYSEKVFNRYIQFIPSPAEAAAIAFPESEPLSKILREGCEKLGVTNIRIMFRIRNIASELLDIIKDADEDVRTGILKSLIVLVWVVNSPIGEGAPTLQFIKEKRENQYIGLEKDALSDEEAKWGVMLTDYGFTYCDDLDLVMLSGIENGFFNDEKIGEKIVTLTQDVSKRRALAGLEVGWGPFHLSFDNNPDEVAASIYNGCVNNIMYLSSNNLSAAVNILKETGHSAEAADLLKKYIHAHDSDEIFDLAESPFGDLVTEPDVVLAFAEKMKNKGKKLPTPVDAASRIGSGGWNPEDEESLAAVSVDEFIQYFKMMRGNERRKFIFGSLAFRNMGGRTPRQQQIVDNALSALVRIGQESTLNAHRLKAYNVTLPQEEQGKTPG